MPSSYARLIIGVGLLVAPLCCSAQIPPLSMVPSQSWDGNDGPWSSFAIRIGTPEQLVHVLPSTAVQATWVLLSGDCLSSISPNCDGSRGGGFSPNQSTTWLREGNFELGFEPNQNRSNLNAGYYGYDQLSLGSPRSDGPTLQNQVIAVFLTSQLYLGVVGLNPQSINLTDFNNPKPSLLSSLRSAGKIPRLSYGYTAGAPYRGKSFYASLTLGGNDPTRFSSNGVSFMLAPHNDRDLVIAIQSINISTKTGTHSALNGSLTPTFAYIDSTLPHIWLPLSACEAFEAAFGITWDSATDLYLINDTLHQTLLAMNANITFQLGETPTGGPTVEIVLPYASFDLSVSWPIVANTTRYFPLRRAKDNQVTLGRTFLQESYLTVDYERRNFTIAQTVFNGSASHKVDEITAPSSATTPNGSATTQRGSNTQNLPSAAVAGIVIGVIVVISFILFLIIRYRKGKAKKLELKMRGLEISEIDGKPVAEIDGQQLPVMADGTPVHEVAGVTPSQEMEAGTRPIYELASEEPDSRGRGM